MTVRPAAPFRLSEPSEQVVFSESSLSHGSEKSMRCVFERDHVGHEVLTRWRAAEELIGLRARLDAMRQQKGLP